MANVQGKNRACISIYKVIPGYNSFSLLRDIVSFFLLGIEPNRAGEAGEVRYSLQ